jgi:hypothetical protein
MEMDKVAPRAASGTAINGSEKEPPWSLGMLLRALRWNWRHVYEITEHPDDGLVITRLDRHGTSFRAADPVEARDMILADQAVAPFAPSPEPGVLGRRIAFQQKYPHMLWMPPIRVHRVVWTGAGGKLQEVAAPTVDLLLRRMQDRGFPL